MPDDLVILKSNLSHTGGLEKYAKRCALSFAEKGCKVTVLTTEEDCINHPNIEIVTFKKPFLPGFLRIKNFDTQSAKWIRENKPSIVFGMDRNRHQTHIRAGNGVHAAFLESRDREGAAKGLSFSINPLHKTILKIEKEAFEHPLLQKIITNSLIVKNEILSHYSVDPKKIEVVHNGVEWNELENEFSAWQIQKEKTLKELSLDSNTFHFLFVGNGYHRKGLIPLFEGLSCIRNENFHLSVLGKEKNPGKFYDLAKKHKIEKKVTFFGIQDPYNFYQFADCLVIPSFYDPFANVTLEALAMGLFVISSTSNGASEILDSDNGCIIDTLSEPEAVAQALKKALSHPKTAQSSRKIRQSVESYDFSHQLKKIIELVLCND